MQYPFLDVTKTLILETVIQSSLLVKRPMCFDQVTIRQFVHNRLCQSRKTRKTDGSQQSTRARTLA